MEAAKKKALEEPSESNLFHEVIPENPSPFPELNLETSQPFEEKHLNLHDVAVDEIGWFAFYILSPFFLFFFFFFPLND